MERRIVVPEGMLKAACYIFPLINDEDCSKVRSRLESALRWLSENPIVPTDEQALSMKTSKERFEFDSWEWVRWGAVEWQSRMFAPPVDPRIEKIVSLIQHFPADMSVSDLAKRILAALKEE